MAGGSAGKVRGCHTFSEVMGMVGVRHLVREALVFKEVVSNSSLTCSRFQHSYAG